MSRGKELLAVAVGLGLGLALGLTYAWVIDPVELYNTTPAYLRWDYQHDWIRMAALGYAVDGDLERALARLGGLDDEEVHTALAALIESYADQGRPAETMRMLSSLARRLGVDTPAMLVYLGTPSAPTIPLPTPSPSPVTLPPLPSPAPTSTPTPFLSPLPGPFLHRVVSQTLVCDGGPPRLALWVQSEAGEEEEAAPLPGVTLWLTWPGGADRAVTGLKPDRGAGYADFNLEVGVPYALSLGEPNAPVLSGLAVQPCPADEGAQPQPGSWWVVIEVRR